MKPEDESRKRPAERQSAASASAASRGAQARHGFGELLIKAYRASEDVDHQVEEALRLGREEPLGTQESVRLVEKILRRLQNPAEPDDDVRSRAERIVRRRESES